MTIPLSLQRLIAELSKLPSIGPRQATRLAFHFLSNSSGRARSLAQALESIKNIKSCAQCFFYFEDEESTERLCDICRNSQRNQSLLCIVEKETDLISLENSGSYAGTYCVLGGHVLLADTPRRRRDDETTVRARARLQQLKAALPSRVISEIIIATNPTSEGDLTAFSLKKELESLVPKISRLGRGIPVGGDVEFADGQTLAEALKNRS